MTPDTIEQLSWPKNARELRHMSIEQWQAWYLSQDPTYMVFLGQNKEFKRFVFYNYTLPVKCLRLYYKIKRFLQRQYV
jgi:hypothetical protein